MAQVSRYPISKQIADRIFEVFIKSLLKVHSAQEAHDFAHDLFSPAEKIMLAKRLSIAFLLMKGYQYREISKLLRVSLGTIRNINLSLKLGRGGYENILGKIAKEEKLEDFFLNVVSKSLSPLAAGKSAGWKYLKTEVEIERAKRKRSF